MTKKVVKKIRTKLSDGSLSDYIPIGAESENVGYSDTNKEWKNLKEKISDIDSKIQTNTTDITVNIPQQISNAKAEAIGSIKGTKVDNAKNADFATEAGSAGTATSAGSATNVTGTVAIGHGGTGATTAPDARTNLGLKTAATYNVATALGTGTDSVPRTDVVNTAINNLKPVVLYDNASGNTGNIPLSQTAANFNYLVIYYRNASYNQMGSTIVCAPNGKNAIISYFFSSSMAGTGDKFFGYATENITISATTIIRNKDNRRQSGAWNLGTTSISPGTPVSDATIQITKVVGYK